MASAVTVRNLSKKYGDFTALDGISLDVEEGSLFALLGPNGAGKTTLMRILTTQLHPSGGEASVLGKDVERNGAEVRNLVSYLPQEMSVWTDISGYENLLIYSKIYGLPAGTREEAIRSALETMELQDVQHHLVNTYSGGMIRKLEIACAVMIRPRVLFLDEPTIGLDPTARKTVWEKIKAINRESGISVFFTTHYMDEAGSYADMIGIINHGKIIKVATPEELKHSVGDDRIDIELGSEPGPETAVSLRKIDGVSGVQAHGRLISVLARDSSAALNQVIGSLVKSKEKVVRISASKPTIEDVFLKYAGSADSRERAGTVAELKKTRERIRRS